MTWRESMAALQLEAEERIGAPLRALNRREAADEDAAFEETRRQAERLSGSG